MKTAVKLGDETMLQCSQHQYRLLATMINKTVCNIFLILIYYCINVWSWKY